MIILLLSALSLCTGICKCDHNATVIHLFYSKTMVSAAYTINRLFFLIITPLDGRVKEAYQREAFHERNFFSRMCMCFFLYTPVSNIQHTLISNTHKLHIEHYIKSGTTHISVTKRNIFSSLCLFFCTYCVCMCVCVFVCQGQTSPWEAVVFWTHQS